MQSFVPSLLVAFSFLRYNPQMDIVASHITAFHWYLRNANPLRGSTRQCRMRRLPPVAPSAESARDALFSLSLSDECLNVTVSCESGRRSSEALRSHLCSDCLPPGAVVPLDFLSPGNRLFLSSPEFTFLQLAATYPLEQAAYFGFALCSSYRIDEWTPGGITLRAQDDPSPTTTRKIAAFLDKIGPVRGSARARRALTYVHDNSFSPMESGLALSFGMPLRHGGFNLGNVTMNPAIKIRANKNTQGDSRFITRRPDILIEAKGRDGIVRRVAIDYDSSSFHAGQVDIVRDIERRNEFAALPTFTHFSLASPQVHDFNQYQQTAIRIRRALGKRDDPSRKAGEAQADFEARRTAIWYKQFALWSEVVRPSEFRRLE